MRRNFPFAGDKGGQEADRIVDGRLVYQRQYPTAYRFKPLPASSWGFGNSSVAVKSFHPTLFQRVHHSRSVVRSPLPDTV